MSTTLRGILIVYMEITHTVLLAFLQGVTEFLPVSSSAHLLIASNLLGQPIQTLGFDIAVHFATFLAVLIYFAKDICALIVKYFSGDKVGRAYVHALALGTIPVIIIGLTLYSSFDTFRIIPVIAYALIISGFFLFIFDYVARKDLVRIAIPMERRGLIIGLFQALALIPGVSRSGIAIAGGRLMGFSRSDATRFSFLLSIPTITAAVILSAIDSFVAFIDLIVSAGSVTAAFNIEIASSLVIAVVVAFAVALIVIHLFLKTVERIGFSWFFVYQVILGMLLLIYFW